MACRAHPLVRASGLTSGRVAALGIVAALAAGGCVEAFDGSNVQIDFGMGVQTSARSFATRQVDQPPPNTHYELYAADVKYQLDAAGQPVVDDQGEPIVVSSIVFEVTEFEISPAIDRSSPCLIDLEDSPHPGLHVTQFAAAVKADTGITDPFVTGQDPDKVTDVLNAMRRVDNLEMIERELRAVTSYDPARYPPAEHCPPENANDMPAPSCNTPAANAQRLRLCKAFWTAHPTFYEGSDKVFTLPLNGRYLGMVGGTNPLNGGSVGGSSMFVDANLVHHDAYFLNWQYDDHDAPPGPDFHVPDPAPASPDHGLPVIPTSTGYLYMSGRPVSITRGVTTVPLRHPLHPSLINADLAILPNLGHDDVHF